MPVRHRKNSAIPLDAQGESLYNREAFAANDTKKRNCRYGKIAFRPCGRYPDDRRATIQKYPAVQCPADFLTAFAGAVQHGGRSCRREIFQRDSARLRRLYVNARHAVYGLSHRPVQRRQCPRSAVSRRTSGRRHAKLRPHGADLVYAVRRRDRGFVLFPGRANAGTAENEGRSAARRSALFPHLRARYAGARHFQLRQRRPERQRRHEAAPGLSDGGRHPECDPEPVLRHRLQNGRRRRGAGKHHLTVSVGGSGASAHDAADRQLPRGVEASAPAWQRGRAHSRPRRPGGDPAYDLCGRESVHSGRHQLV